MGCGCNKGLRNIGRRPIVTPRQRSIVKPDPPKTNNSIPPAEGSEEQRSLERQRRARIARKTLGNNN